MDKSEKKTAPTSFPDLETLKTVHDVYRVLSGSDITTFAQAADKLHVDASLMHRRIERFEQAIQRTSDDTELQLFERGKGKATQVITDNRVVQLMEDVAAIVSGYKQLSESQPRRLTLRFGASMTACSYLIPRIIANGNFRDVDFEFTHAKPLRLRAKVDAAECDFVLTAVSGEFDDRHKHVVKCVELPMALLTPLDFQVRPKGFRWQHLRADALPLVLLREEPDRYPMPEYPLEVVPRHVVVHRIESTSLCHSLVIDGQAMTISLPQFLTPRQREFVHIVRAPGIGTMRLALLEPRQTSRHSKLREAKLEALRSVLVDELVQLEKVAVADSTTEILHMYHVTRTKKPIWLHGKVDWRVDNDEITGHYSLKYPRQASRPRLFTLRGHVSSNPGPGKPRCHVACRGVTLDGADEFVFHLTCPSRDWLFEELTGFWAGRPSWNANDRFSPYVGAVVVSREELPPAELNRKVVAYREEHKLPEVALADAMGNA